MYKQPNNPFDKPETDTITVISVKNGYILYEVNNWQASLRKRTFLNITNKLK